jgi:ornithine cyclodeaminase/alanine dehydrogenase-like protein (mu-crystallin family)
MRYLDAAALRAALPMPEAIESMVSAFGDDREVPVRVRLGSSLFMPGRVGGHTGVKVVSVVPGRPAGIVMVFGPDGDPLGLVDGQELTRLRTGAASGLATRLLARPDAKVLAMLGAGAMAFDQIEAVRSVRSIERVLVWSRTTGRASDLAGSVGGEAMADADAAVALADVVCCATPATEPLFDDRSVLPGTHINAVGAFTPEMAEIPPGTLRRAFVVVDDEEAALSEAGDLIRAGRFPPDASIADLLTGRQEPGGRPVTVFKSVGIASQDVAAAVRALEHAEQADLGIPI